MTDQELSSLGERLYGAIIAARLSEPALEDLAGAISARRPWVELAERTKIAVFVVATQMSESDNSALEESLEPPPPPFDSLLDMRDVQAVEDTGLGRDVFDSGVEATIDEASEKNRRGQVADTSVINESSNTPIDQPVLAAETTTPEESVDKGDESDSEDADSSASRLLGKSRRKSSS